VGWPEKTFRSAHVTLKDLDVIHSGFGGCVVPFGFAEMWSDAAGVESHTDYRFEDIRLEDFYSLAQMRMVNPPGIDGVVFRNIASMDGGAMVPSVMSGPVQGVEFNGVRVAGKVAARDADVPVEVSGGAAEPEFEPELTDASWTYAPGLIRPREAVTFRVTAPAEGWRYEWLFGDGTRAEGAVVRHAFPDAEGTLLDGSGRFRVLLHATRGRDEVWVSRGVVVAGRVEDAVGSDASGNSALPPCSNGGNKGGAPGCLFREIPPPTLSQLRRQEWGTQRGTEYEGGILVPADGGYTFTLLTSRKATLTLDDLPVVVSPELRMQVCGLLGDAVQAVRISAGLKAGYHAITIQLEPGIENEPDGNLGAGGPMLLWEGPGMGAGARPMGKSE
jgi:hypothetical protein